MTTEQLQIIQQQQAEWKQKQQERFAMNKQRIFAALVCAGVDEVTVAYSGEGDEGHLDDPEFSPEVDLRGQSVWIEQAQSVEMSLRPPSKSLPAICWMTSTALGVMGKAHRER